MKENNEILIIDDEIDICKQVSGLLNDKGFSSKYKFTAEDGLELLKSKKISLVLLDIWLNNSKFDGFQTLEKIRNIDENIPVIMISGHGNIETAVNSIKKGAYDFVEKPFDGELLIFKVKKALENFDLKNQLIINNLNSNLKFVAKSESSKKLENNLKKITKTDSSILLFGENGSGKEFISRKIHSESNRFQRNLRVFNFKAVNENEVESSLFGKDQNHTTEFSGIFEQVEGGTLFFKNIEKISKKIQGKLLRVLQEKKYYKVGGVSPKFTNFRILASSIFSLNKLRKDKIIRDDLLKVINFYEISIPSIRERTSDIDELIKIFIDDFFSKNNYSKKDISKDLLTFFSTIKYIKNVSQLKKFIEWSLFILCDNNKEYFNKESLFDLISGILGVDNNSSYSSRIMDTTLKIARDNFERDYLKHNLSKFKNNISKMSFEIGMDRTALYRKLKSMKINVD